MCHSHALVYFPQFVQLPRVLSRGVHGEFGFRVPRIHLPPPETASHASCGPLGNVLIQIPFDSNSESASCQGPSL